MSRLLGYPVGEPGKLRQRFASSVADAQSRLVDLEALEATLEQLVAEGVVSGERAADLRSDVREQLDGSRYILGHLANQTWLSRTGRSYEQFRAETRAPIRRIGRWLVPVPA